MMMKSISFVWYIGVCAAALSPSGTAAQSGSAPMPVDGKASTPADAKVAPQSEAQPTSAEPTDTTDIIVTANKREERLLNVPISVVAINGDRLQRLNLSTATDLQFVTPGLGLGDSNTPRGAGLRIRGVGTTVFADGVEQSVGTVVDGIPLARAGQGLAELVDVERVEVLRGPQGMLFGRNASAGLINIITQLPTEKLSFTGNASYASENEVKLGGSLSGALIPGAVSARVTGFLNRRDGFVTNLVTGHRLNNQNEYGARGVVEIKPTSGLQFILRGDWAKRDTQCCIWTARSFASASPIRPARSCSPISSTPGFWRRKGPGTGSLPRMAIPSTRARATACRGRSISTSADTR
ncbi:TonB-dependent receptor [uncultured Sphingomonas sp.]|uniref:TonB-dependent receptor n=1 Tax=uncultured Sphingomonas sp. TaxID=158754 RepID=UPI0035CAFDF3